MPETCFHLHPADGTAPTAAVPGARPTSRLAASERLLAGRDPRDAWLFTQRLGSSWPTAQALASLRAVETTLGLELPAAVGLLRSLLSAAEFLQDHLVSFYTCQAWDWVDPDTALHADPARASALAASQAHWPVSRTEYFAAVRHRLEDYAASGRSSPFPRPCPGHPAYRLPTEAGLLFSAHAMEVHDWQRNFIHLQLLLGGPGSRRQAYRLGGMKLPSRPEGEPALNPDLFGRLRALLAQTRLVVDQVYLPDLKLLAAHYPEDFHQGSGPGCYLSCGEFAAGDDTRPGSGQHAAFFPAGFLAGGRLQPFDPEQMGAKFARSQPGEPAADSLNPDQDGADQLPALTAVHTGAGAVSGTPDIYPPASGWQNRVVEVGPLARLRIACAAGHPEFTAAVHTTLGEFNLEPRELNSTLGRVLARGLEASVLAARMPAWLDRLEAAYLSGGAPFEPDVLPEDWDWPETACGWGAAEAPDGTLCHRLELASDRLVDYQMLLPEDWNSSPASWEGQPGPLEQALLGIPITTPQQPLEIWRLIHAFAPGRPGAVAPVDPEIPLEAVP